MPAPERWWKRPAVRAVIVVLAVLPALGMVGLILFMWRVEGAHDRQACPFVQGEVQRLDEERSVREDRRRCLDDVEERRWVLLRQGQPEMEMGSRRLEFMRWGDGYHWEVDMEDARARVRIHNVGLHPRTFREPSSEGLAAPPHWGPRPADSE